MNETILEDRKVNDGQRRRNKGREEERKKIGKEKRTTKREISCSPNPSSLRYDNISQAPGKHWRRSPEGMLLPKLARRPPLSEILRARGRCAGERKGQKRCGFSLSSFRSYVLSLSPFRLHVLDVKREILNKTGCY